MQLNFFRRQEVFIHLLRPIEVYTVIRSQQILFTRKYRIFTITPSQKFAKTYRGVYSDSTPEILFTRKYRIFTITPSQESHVEKEFARLL